MRRSVDDIELGVITNRLLASTTVNSVKSTGPVHGGLHGVTDVKQVHMVAVVGQVHHVIDVTHVGGVEVHGVTDVKQVHDVSEGKEHGQGVIDVTQVIGVIDVNPVAEVGQEPPVPVVAGVIDVNPVAEVGQEPPVPVMGVSVPVPVPVMDVNVPVSVPVVVRPVMPVNVSVPVYGKPPRIYTPSP